MSRIKINCSDELWVVLYVKMTWSWQNIPDWKNLLCPLKPNTQKPACEMQIAFSCNLYQVHAVPGWKKTEIALHSSYLGVRGRECAVWKCPIITSAQLLCLLPSPTVYHALHVKKSNSSTKPTSSYYMTTVTKLIWSFNMYGTSKFPQLQQ